MARSCDTVRGGIRCGRTAKVKVGLAVAGHRPDTYRFYCAGCGELWQQRVNEILDDDVRAEVIDL